MTFFSPTLRVRRFYLIYFPPGYHAGGSRKRRLPVLYLLHPGPGQPADFVNVGALQATFRSELRAHLVKPMLVVMPDGHVPKARTDAEWSNTRVGKYEGLVLDTVRAVDRRWPTRADRRHRMLAGLSTGGYAAANITLHHLRTFGSFESWSGFFIEDRSQAFRAEPESVLLRNSPAVYLPRLRTELRRYPVRALVYQGWQDPEQTYYALFVRRARAAGIRLTSAKFPGGHDWRLWRWRMKYDLRYASAVLSGSRVPASVTKGMTPGGPPPDLAARATRQRRRRASKRQSPSRS